jgi:hypothetical protein
MRPKKRNTHCAWCGDPIEDPKQYVYCTSERDELDAPSCAELAAAESNQRRNRERKRREILERAAAGRSPVLGWRPKCVTCGGKVVMPRRKYCSDACSPHRLGKLLKAS